MWGTPSLSGKVAWVTGGGSGIGRACAEELGRRGALVIVSGRRLDRLDEAVAAVRGAGGEAHAVVCDVTEDASVGAAVASIVGQHGRLDIALANAGFSVAGKIEQLSDDDWQRQFDVNVFGAIRTIRHSLPELHKTSGRLALVGSVSSFIFIRRNGAYNASKAAIRAIGETLSAELVGTTVSCTTIHPGFVTSEIAQVDNAGVHDPNRKDRRPQALLWDADAAARVMVDGIARRRTELVFTGHGSLAVALTRFAPSLARLIAARL